MRQPLGQHFLRDQLVVQTIFSAAELKATDTALEIGPGKGVLTAGLLARVKRLVAVELDKKLAQNLKNRFGDRLSLSLVQGDILKTELDALFPAADQPIKVLGNLPYSITSPIFEKIISWPGWETCVFLIQREVAERISAKPGSRDYGILTLAVWLFADSEIIRQVKPGAFLPAPQVSSSVIRLRRKVQSLVAAAEIPNFFDLIHGAFAHRRKTIANSLAFHAHLERSEVEKWLRTNDADPGSRAETIAPEHYAKMAGAWSIFRREINLT